MQVPAPVGYAKAHDLDDALAMLKHYGAESRLIAGGHSLLPMMRLRLAQPEYLIDINDLSTLAYVKVVDNELRIGAMTRHSELLASAVAYEHYPIIRDAERVIADPIVRNRGTVGGSLCQADPAEDLSAVFAALKATVVLRASTGERIVPLVDFHTGPYSTVVGPEEILTEVRVPIRPGAGSAYEKVERRVGDWAIAAVGAVLWMEGDRISDVGIGIAAAGALHFHSAEAEAFLVGKEGTLEEFSSAARLAAEHCSPTSDQRGPEDYKRHLVGVLTERSLSRAAARTRGESE